MWPLLLIAAYLAIFCFAHVSPQSSNGWSAHTPKPPEDLLRLWIDRRQVKIFSGLSIDIDAIRDERISPYILDPKFEEYLPMIPSEVGYVNFTWQSGVRKYVYHFDKLESHNKQILESPQISIPVKGRIPKRPKAFSVKLPCSGNGWGIARFSIGLKIEPRKGKPSEEMSLRVSLRKECAQRGPDPECDKKCANDGWCNAEKICQCPEGYMGQYCQTALCYPQCMNGGSCIAPGVCSCLPGFQGRHCEGGICFDNCKNHGKCIQKDTCECNKGHYGLRCEFSRCIIPCMNDGKCRGVNKCRCKKGFGGDHCEIVYGTKSKTTSKRNSKRHHGGGRNARGHNKKFQ
ncbi:protein shifted isoform X2 [Neocloeon triangulifer]|uniref:protein shifted isoform X2 n=1 Tax=Neocloeon triangulifer TaxID=2078957 RepID=UPI00286EF063|nr:protein shifted isoform X2 [Neocloeon triangulifer]